MFCITLEIWQAPISAGKRHLIVISPNQDIRPQLSSCSDPYYSFQGMDPILICYKKNFTLGWKEKLVGFQVFFNLCCLSLLWRLQFKSRGRVDIVGRSEWKICTLIKLQPDVSSTRGRASPMCCTPKGTTHCLLKVAPGVSPRIDICSRDTRLFVQSDFHQD